MPEITEGKYAGEFIASEANGTRSRDVVTILSGAGILSAATVLGQITKAAATAAAIAGNTGDGAMGAITVGAGAKVGDYRLTFIEPEANAGDFIVEDPDGVNVGAGKVGAQFVGGGLTFTLADGATDFVSGDQFLLTVATGSEKYNVLDPAGVDGTEEAAAILYNNIDATSADVEAVAIVRDAEVNGAEIVWPAGIQAADKDAAIAQLAARGIIIR